MKYKVLFPCDPFNMKNIDADYKLERNICDMVDIKHYMFDYDTFVGEGKFKHNIDMTDECVLIYRGWMLQPKQYTDLSNKLIMKSGGKVSLINTPKEYETCHCFPNVYPLLHDYTPLIRVLTKLIEHSDFEDLLRNIPYDFFIKDFVKSVKTENGVERISKDISPKDLKYKILDFMEERGKLFTGGIVLKEFIDLAKYNNGKSTNEWRAFCFNGKVMSLIQNSSLKTNVSPSNELVKSICEKIEKVSNFFTIDFAEMKNGYWIVIETGDGQVSGFPDDSSLEMLGFYNKITKNESIF